MIPTTKKKSASFFFKIALAIAFTLYILANEAVISKCCSHHMELLSNCHVLPMIKSPLPQKS